MLKLNFENLILNRYLYHASLCIIDEFFHDEFFHDFLNAILSNEMLYEI